MPGCVLRVQSATTNVEALVKAVGLRPIIVHRKGEPRVPGARTMSHESGFNVEVSSSDRGLDEQAEDAIRFLRRHDAGLRRLRRCRAFQGMTLDFGLYDRTSRERPWPSYRLSSRLIALAGKHGIEIELSFYGSEPRGGSSANRIRRR